MADLFGNLSKAAPDALTRELETRKLPDPRNPKKDPKPHRYVDGYLIDGALKALQSKPDLAFQERRKFRYRAATDAKYLHKKTGRALPVGLLYTEFFMVNIPEGA